MQNVLDLPIGTLVFTSSLYPHTGSFDYIKIKETPGYNLKCKVRGWHPSLWTKAAAGTFPDIEYGETTKCIDNIPGGTIGIIVGRPSHAALPILFDFGVYYIFYTDLRPLARTCL